jgi:hypothetical protein
LDTAVSPLSGFVGIVLSEAGIFVVVLFTMLFDAFCDVVGTIGIVVLAVAVLSEIWRFLIFCALRITFRVRGDFVAVLLVGVICCALALLRVKVADKNRV